QLPSDEEEARADGLADGEGDGDPAAPAAGQPAPQPPASAESAESAYQARVKALTEGLKRAITSGTEAGAEARLRVSEAHVFARKQDFAQAAALLEVVEEQIRLALAAAPEAAANGTAQPPAGGKEVKPAAQAPAGGDPATEFKAKLAEWTPAIKKAL